MPRRYKVRYSDGSPVIHLPLDDERIFPPVVYGCKNCGKKFYHLRDFVDHLTLKHGIPPSQAWRCVEPKEIR